MHLARRRTALAAGLVLVLAACSPSTQAQPLPEIFITTDDYEFVAPSNAPGGLVRVVAENHGSHAHMIDFLRVRDGFEVDEVLAAVRRVDPAVHGMVVYHGGPNEVPRGQRRAVVTRLDPGTYVIACWVVTNNQIHVQLGMTGTIEITEPDAPPPTDGGAPVAPDKRRPPEASIEVVLSDYRIEVSGELKAGTRVAHIRNEGSQPHEFALFRGASAAGGSASLSPGRELWVELVLEPGEYTAECWVPLESGLPHIRLGMQQTIVIED
jgi:plastocyanin